MSTNKPHPHADAIKAWADGHPIQAQIGRGVWIDSEWPTWNVNANYRVKPVSLIRYVPILQMRAKPIVVGNTTSSEACARMQASDEHDLVGILRIELDPQTGELVSASVDGKGDWK